MKLINRTKNRTVSEQLVVANSFGSRLKGLLGKKSIPNDLALWIPRCDSIHTFFMKFPIDVVFVDGNFVVRRLYRNLLPWRMTLPNWTNKSVFEFASGVIDSTPLELGDQLYVGD